MLGIVQLEELPLLCLSLRIHFRVYSIESVFCLSIQKSSKSAKTVIALISSSMTNACTSNSSTILECFILNGMERSLQDKHLVAS